MSNWKDKIKGGLADKRKPSDFDRKALEAGIKVEMEHTNDPHMAKEIAMDHLEEDPKYYEKLSKIEGVNKMKKLPKLTELFILREWQPELPGVERSSTKSSKPQDKFDKLANKRFAKSFDAAKRKAKKDPMPSKQDQFQAPGMDPDPEDAFSRKWGSKQKKGQFQKQQDGRLPLDQVVGKFMHVSQGSPEALQLMQNGHTYETMPKRALGQINDRKTADWGSGTFRINDDGTFEQVSANWDSSG